MRAGLPKGLQMYEMRRHGPFAARRMHQSWLPQAVWQRQLDREEEFLRTAALLRARRKSRALAAMGIVAAAGLMVGGTHVAARGADEQPRPPASVIDCAPATSWQVSAVDERVSG